ncbi:DUF4214 domain-containing protein [Myxosarcina sp. GI1(2024)]
MSPDYLTEKIGTSENDNILGSNFEVIYSLAGNDTLRASDEALVSMAGGSGDDRYEFQNNVSIAIYENGNSNNDVIVADNIGDPEDYVDYLIDDRHLFTYNEDSGAYLAVIDWQVPENRIEKFIIEGQEFSYEDLVSNSADFENISLTELDNLLEIDLSSATNKEIEGIFARAEELENNGETPNPPTSLELTGGTAQIAYVAYYSRPADNDGLEFWNHVLEENNVSYAPRDGDRLIESETDVYNRIVDAFGNAAEAERLFGQFDSDRDRVNQVYQFAFNRHGDEGGLDYWTNQIERGNVTLATFALEVALGAQNQDIVVLNNKIESADLFTNSIDTQAERNAYQGSSGEIFGRNWLSQYGSTISSQSQVDTALNDLVG